MPHEKLSELKAFKSWDEAAAAFAVVMQKFIDEPNERTAGLSLARELNDNIFRLRMTAIKPPKSKHR